MVYFIIWEMHGFPHQFPIVQENATKSIIWRRTWEIGTQTCSIVWVLFFPLDSHFVVYFITWEMHVSSHQFPITWEKTAKPIEWGKSGKLVPDNILQNPSYVFFSHRMCAFFPLDSHPTTHFIT